jgi:Orsellinic acid/F9775 biosynthesis cluster protein D
MEYFHHLVEYQLAVCKECQYAVWPEQIAGHLHGKHHKIPRKQANKIAEEVCSWFGLIPFASELEVPNMIDQPIPQLPLYEDGLMCQSEPEKCSYICRDKKTLKHHLRKSHQYSVALGPGGSGTKRKQMIESRFENVVKHVHCQRFFPKYHGSQYFEVRTPKEVQNDQARAVAREELWDQVHDRALKRWAEVEKRSRETIQEGQKKEANPWLERTGWSKYLKQLNRNELLECIREPKSDPDEKEEKEVVERVIWQAMGEIARISQASIINRVGVFVRKEAIRTEQNQTKYQPLQAYQHEEEIEDHVRSWRQVLMFFVRTQKEHDWESPKYRFTNAQQQAWNRLIEKAKQVSDEEKESSNDEEEEEDEQEEEEDMEDDSESEAEIDETDQARPKPLTGIQKACLDFCIELLNQTVTQREYDSALVCALAILGVHEDGWKGPDRYPPILSSIIKIARFMVVQKALEIAGNDEFNNDVPYDFGLEDQAPMPARRRGQEGCLQLVTRMMDAFMVRGSHSPMQWMLDLRTYGLKIHYNTTATGHIGWQGHDEILYKNVQFNMSQFRSMVHGLVEQCRQMIEEELLFCGKKYPGEQMPKVPWKLIRDNPTDERSGWNFLQDQRTKMPVDGQTWLYDRIGRDRDIRQQFLRVGSQSGVNQEGMRAYMGQVVKFKEKLLMLMHITGESVSYD